MYLPLLLGCTATLQITSNPPGATAYITDHFTNQRPMVAEAGGPTPLYAEISFFAWEQYYLWVEAPGYRPHAMMLPGELKVGPLVGGLFCLFPFVWVWGPEQTSLHVELVPDVATPVQAPPPADRPRGW